MAKKLFVENHTGRTLYVLLDARDGALHVHVFGRPEGNAELLAPGKALVYHVKGALARCLRGRTLSYEIHNRSGQSIVFDGGRERRAEGPCFKIETPRELLN